LTTIQATYQRTVSEPGTYSSVKIGGMVELEVETEDWQREHSIAYAALKTNVDAVIEAATASFQKAPTTPPQAQESDSSSSPESAPSAATSEVSQPGEIVPFEKVEYEGCRVFLADRKTNSVAVKKGSGGKTQMRIRIGNPDIPGQYVDAKSFDPDIWKVMELLREKDMVNIKGHFDKPWQDKYDLVVEEISRA